MTDKSFIDKMFDAADEVVGALETNHELSKETSEKPHEEVIEAEYTHTPKTKYIWGFVDGSVSGFHLFSGFSISSLCGRTFEPLQIKTRKAEMEGTSDSSMVNCCCTCLRILQSKCL